MLWYVLFGIVAVPLAVLNLLVPLLILKTQRVPAHVKFLPLPEEEFLAARSAVFNQLDSELKKMGFLYGGSSMLKNTATESYFSLYGLPGDTACAMLVTINSAIKSMTYLEYCQGFVNDTVLDINNADVVSAYPRMKQKVMLRYPQVNDPVALLEVFKKIRATMMQNVPAKPWDPEQGIAVVEESLARESDELVRLGYCCADVGDDGMRALTLKGAYVMTWKSVFPGKQIQNGLDLRRANLALRKSLA